MKVTKVNVFLVDEERLKAYISIVIDDELKINDLRVIAGHQGLFVAMPSKRRPDGTFKDVVHPINSESRAQLEKPILEAYLEELKKL